LKGTSVRLLKMTECAGAVAANSKSHSRTSHGDGRSKDKGTTTAGLAGLPTSRSTRGPTKTDTSRWRCSESAECGANESSSWSPISGSIRASTAGRRIP
jgi:hypothetical protein